MAQIASFTNVVASGAILAAPGRMAGCNLTGGSDAATLILYDHASSATGTIICKLAAAAGVSVTFFPPVQLRVANGIYAALTGTAPSATVLFTP